MFYKFYPVNLDRSKKEAKKFIKFNETNPVIYIKNNQNIKFDSINVRVIYVEKIWLSWFENEKLKIKEMKYVLL